jgi:hypothetical protein
MPKPRSTEVDRLVHHAQRLAHVGVEFSLGDAGLLEVHDVKEVVAEVFRELRSADLRPHGWHAEREHRGDTLHDVLSAFAAN